MPSLPELNQENFPKNEVRVRLTPVKPKRIEREMTKIYQDIIKKQPLFEETDMFKKELKTCLVPLPAFHGRRLITRINENERCSSLNSLNTVINSQSNKDEGNKETDDEAKILLKKLFTNEGINAPEEALATTLETEFDKMFTPGFDKGNKKNKAKIIKRISLVREPSPQKKALIAFKNFKLFEETFLRINLPQPTNKENLENIQIGTERCLPERLKQEGLKTERNSYVRTRTRSSFRIGTEISEDKSILTRSNSKIMTGRETKTLLNNTGNNTETQITNEGENITYLRSKSNGRMIRIVNGDIPKGLSLNEINKKESTVKSERHVVSCNLTKKSMLMIPKELKDTSIMDNDESDDAEMYMKQIERKDNKNL